MIIGNWPNSQRKVSRSRQKVTRTSPESRQNVARTSPERRQNVARSRQNVARKSSELLWGALARPRDAVE